MGLADRARSKWARTARFAMGPTGVDAEAAYRASVVASRHEAGRASYDAARAEWALTYSLEPDDGVYLGQLHDGPATVSDIVQALEPCGKTREDALGALGRLVDAGLVVVTSSGER